MPRTTKESRDYGRLFRERNREHYNEYHRQYRARKKAERREKQVEEAGMEFDKLKERIGETYEDLQSTER